MKLAFFLLFLATATSAAELNITAGLGANGVDEAGADANEYGASVKARYLDYKLGSGVRNGWTFAAHLRSIWSTDVWAGWGARFGQKVFFEVAGGGALGLVPGPGIFALAALGYQLSPRINVSVPFSIRTSMYWEVQPYIGFKF